MDSSTEYLSVKTECGPLFLEGDNLKSWQAFLSETIKKAHNVANKGIKVESDFDAFECIDIDNYLLKEEEQYLQLAVNNNNTKNGLLDTSQDNIIFSLNSSFNTSAMKQTEVIDFSINNNNKDKIYAKIMEKAKKSQNKIIQNSNKKQINLSDSIIYTEKLPENVLCSNLQLTNK